MNHKSKTGSIVLMVLVFIMVLTAITYATLRTNSYYVSLAHERETYEKYYQLARALYDFIQTKCTDMVKDNIKTTKHIIYKGPWPDNSSIYSGKAWKNDKKKTIHIEIKHNKKIVIHDTYAL